jgi:hypothetical protein
VPAPPHDQGHADGHVGRHDQGHEFGTVEDGPGPGADGVEGEVPQRVQATIPTAMAATISR